MKQMKDFSPRPSVIGSGLRLNAVILSTPVVYIVVYIVLTSPSLSPSPTPTPSPAAL